MATKRAETQNLGYVVIAPDGKVYFVSQQEPKVAPEIVDKLNGCKHAFDALATCLQKKGLLKSNKVVLSGVMNRSNSKLLSPKGMASAKKKRS